MSFDNIDFMHTEAEDYLEQCLFSGGEIEDNR